MKRHVGIIVHRTRREAWEFATKVIAWLDERDIGVRLDLISSQRLGLPSLGCSAAEFETTELVITLGGDGTILTAARLVAPCGVPILGVHMGRFGFIAETHPEDLFTTLELALRGEVAVEERLMLHAEVFRGDELVYSQVGLNDALVKSGISQMLQLRTWLGGAPFATYPADGIIIATPTGSTAYALSAGGPLVMPTVNALILVPICPHTLSARPMVVPGDETIGIEVQSDEEGMIFAVDGVDPFALLSGDEIRVRRAEYVTHLLVQERTSFYRKVRNRYLYGERLNE